MSHSVVIKFGQQIRCRSTGWGPNRLYKQTATFVGVHHDDLKYHFIFDKKPTQPYGLQGVAHLQKDKGVVAGILPVKMKWKKDKMYTWCACGYSYRQPLCDGTHNRDVMPTRMHPVRYVSEKDQYVWLCVCKQTKNRPFCDGSHKNCEDPNTVKTEVKTETK